MKNFITDSWFTPLKPGVIGVILGTMFFVTAKTQALEWWAYVAIIVAGVCVSDALTLTSELFDAQNKLKQGAQHEPDQRADDKKTPVL